MFKSYLYWKCCQGRIKTMRTQLILIPGLQIPTDRSVLYNIYQLPLWTLPVVFKRQNHCCSGSLFFQGLNPGLCAGGQVLLTATCGQTCVHLSCTSEQGQSHYIYYHNLHRLHRGLCSSSVMFVTLRWSIILLSCICLFLHVLWEFVLGFIRSFWMCDRSVTKWSGVNTDDLFVLLLSGCSQD